MRPPVTIAHVRQEEAFGCGPACLAMITGRPYREVRDWFKGPAWLNARHDGRELSKQEREVVELHDFTRHGISDWEVRNYVANHGLASALLPGRVEPFADAHLCSVQMVNGSHFVVLLRDGTLLDPARDGVHSLDDSWYSGGVHYTMGICKMGSLA